MSTTLEGTSLAHKHLLDEDLWERLVKRIMKDENMERALAERIMDQTLAFLQLAALEPEGHYSPSPMVDIGWHTFILYTRHYARFCEKIGGQFIHHDPSDKPTVSYTDGGLKAGPQATVTAMMEHSIAVDALLWASTATDCTATDGDGDQGCRTGPCNY